MNNHRPQNNVKKDRPYFEGKYKSKMSNAKYLTAIFFDAAGHAYKYHNIKGTREKKEKFQAFARSRGAVYVNYYDKESKEFIPPQIKIE